MKKKILIIILLSFISFEAFCVPVISYTRSRKCGWVIGCSDVKKVPTEHHMTLPDSSTWTYYTGVISCTGTGTDACPTTWSSINFNTQTDQVATDNLSVYAISEIENNNNNSGTHSSNYYDSQLQATYAYTVTWSVDADGVQNISIDKVLLPI